MNFFSAKILQNRQICSIFYNYTCRVAKIERLNTNINGVKNCYRLLCSDSNTPQQKSKDSKISGAEYFATIFKKSHPDLKQGAKPEPQPKNVSETVQENENNELKPLDNDIALSESIGINRSALSEATDPSYIDSIAPVLKPTFNLASYINKSPSLQEFVKLGVDLFKLEKDGHTEFVLKLDFNKDVKPYITFLHDLGVPADELGNWFSKNILICNESIHNLNVRINYLKSKKFSKDAITTIIRKSPKFLSFSVKHVDSRLGFFQKEFNLTGQEVRETIPLYPKIVYFQLGKIKHVSFCIKEEFGFSEQQMKKMFLKNPGLWLVDRVKVFEKLDYLNNEMQLSQELIAESPRVLLNRKAKIIERHLYLQKLNRAQFDPSKPGYVHLESFAVLDDVHFCQEIAKTSIDDFNDFLKTL